VDSAESAVQRAGEVKTFREGATDRLNDIAVSATIIIMQRLHTDDVAGTIMALDVGYVHLNLPMEFERERVGPDGKTTGGPCRPTSRASCSSRIRAPKEGELLFPERFPPAHLAKLKKLKGAYAWAGQYQQRPAPREGGIFQRGWFKRALRCRRAAAAGRAGGTLAQRRAAGDYTAGVKGTVDDDAPEDERGFYIAHAVRGQLSGSLVEKLIKDTAKDDGSDCIIRVPQDPGASGKTYANILLTKLFGYPAKAVQPTGSKVTRAKALATQAEAGNVYILVTGDPEADAWIEPFLEELELFPAGTHDDQVDAAADCFNELALPEMNGQALFELARREAEARATEQAEASKETEPTYAPGSLEYMMAMQGEQAA
jgi:predicted phage terminase large subunit-like protein